MDLPPNPVVSEPVNLNSKANKEGEGLNGAITAHYSSRSGSPMLGSPKEIEDHLMAENELLDGDKLMETLALIDSHVRDLEAPVLVAKDTSLFVNNTSEEAY